MHTCLRLANRSLTRRRSESILGAEINWNGRCVPARSRPPIDHPSIGIPRRIVCANTATRPTPRKCCVFALPLLVTALRVRSPKSNRTGHQTAVPDAQVFSHTATAQPDVNEYVCPIYNMPRPGSIAIHHRFRRYKPLAGLELQENHAVGVSLNPPPAPRNASRRSLCFSAASFDLFIDRGADLDCVYVCCAP